MEYLPKYNQKITHFLFHFQFLDSYAFVLPKVHYQIIPRVSNKRGVYTTELKQQICLEIIKRISQDFLDYV